MCWNHWINFQVLSGWDPAAPKLLRIDQLFFLQRKKSSSFITSFLLDCWCLSKDLRISSGIWASSILVNYSNSVVHPEGQSLWNPLSDCLVENADKFSIAFDWGRDISDIAINFLSEQFPACFLEIPSRQLNYLQKSDLYINSY